MTSRTGELLLGVTVTLAVAGCTPEASPEPPPTATTSTVSPTTPPPISRPLDASRYAARESICELLTTEQAAELRVPVKNADPGATSSGTSFTCNRTLRSELSQPTVRYGLWTNRNVLAERYPPEPTEYEFVTMDILGQPAARMRSSHTGPPTQCLLILGLAENQGVEIQASDPDGGKACDLVVAVAEHMVRNLGG